MAGKFMRVKKFAINTLTLVILLSQVTGCAFTSQDETVDLLNNQDEIILEVVVPDNGEIADSEMGPLWVKLADLNTQPEFRSAFDDALNIIPFGETSKNGVIYVNPTDKSWEHNSILRFAFENKAFVDNYWGNSIIMDRLYDEIDNIYLDVEGADYKAAVVNTYWEIYPDEGEGYFNGNRVLTRDEFLSGIVKADMQVPDRVSIPNEIEDLAVNSKFLEISQHALDNSYLDIESGSLNETTFSKGAITRAESIYTIVNRLFPEELSSVDVKKSKTFDDCKNAGDLAGKVGIDKSIDKWKTRELYYALEDTSRGLPEDLYKAMVVAYEKELIPVDYDSRWDEGITKTEAINLIIRAYEELGTTYNAELGESTKLDIEQTEEVVDISGVYRLSDEEKEIIEDAIEIMGLSGEEAEELEYFATTRAEDGFNVKDTIDEIIMEHEEEQAAQQKPVETKAPAKPKQPSKPKTQNQAPPKQQPKPTQPKETQAPKPTQPKPVETQPAERELTLEERNAIRAEMGMEPHGAYTDMTPEEESAAAEAWSKFK